MNSEAIIQRHIELCDEVHTTLLEENRILRQSGNIPGEGFLERKRALIPQLEASLEAIKDIRENGPKPGNRLKGQIQNAQKKLMKIFLLDRENEQLLLKTSVNKKTGILSKPTFSKKLSTMAAARYDASPSSESAKEKE